MPDRLRERRGHWTLPTSCKTAASSAGKRLAYVGRCRNPRLNRCQRAHLWAWRMVVLPTHTPPTPVLPRPHRRPPVPSAFFCSCEGATQKIGPPSAASVGHSLLMDGSSYFCFVVSPFPPRRASRRISRALRRASRRSWRPARRASRRSWRPARRA
jgi:hypothetical protein